MAVISFERAQARALRETRPLAARKVLLPQCRGLVLAGTAVSPTDAPPFDVAAADGFAVRAGELAAASPLFPITLRVAGEAPLRGGGRGALAPGRALRIQLGAPLPLGMDAVVTGEEAREKDERVLEFRAPVAAGTNVAPAGSLVRRGQTLFRAGHLLTPADIGMLASLGFTEALVHLKPRVAMAYLGEDRVLPGRRPGPGRTYDGNLAAIGSFLEEDGIAPASLGIWSPNVVDVGGALRRHARTLELLVTSGGVSGWADDLLPDAIERAGGKVLFQQVRVEPGGATLLARIGKCLLLGLPADAPGVLVGIHFFLLPLVARFMGKRAPAARAEEAVLASAVRRRDGEGDGTVAEAETRILPGKARRTEKGSLVVGAERDWGPASRGMNCLVLLPPGTRPLAAGEKATIVWITPAHG